MQYKKILKHGASKCVIIPAEWARQIGLRLNDYICLDMIEADVIALRKIPKGLQKEIRNVVIHMGNGDLENGTIAKN